MIENLNRNKAGAYVLIALGLALLFGIQNILLPLIFFAFIMLPGLGLLAVYRYNEHKAAAMLTIPGMLIAGTGAILVFQSLTGYWESWAYAWTLYGVFFGLGLMFMGERLEEDVFVQVGRGLTAVSGIAFVGLGLLFVVLTSLTFKMILTAVLLGTGGYMLMKHSGHSIPNIYTFQGKRSDPSVEENIQKIRIA